MAKKKSPGGKLSQPPFKLFFKLVLLGMLIIGLPLTIFVLQTKQTTSTNASSTFPSGGVLGPGPTGGSMGSSQSCINGKCYSCSSESGCSIECQNDSCTCEPGPCKEMPQTSGQPAYTPNPSTAITPGQPQTGSSGKSISCVNGKCFSCESSSGSCSVKCENETCTCEPGPCKEVASEISGIPLPGTGSAGMPQIPVSSEEQKNFIQNIIDWISEFFKNLFR